MRVLVTGAAGCLGRAVCARLIDAGHAVRGVARTMPAAANGPDGPEWRQADLVDADYDRLLAGCDGVVHCAALVHRADVRDEALYRRMNVGVAEDLLAAAARAGLAAGRFVFISSTSVYGDLPAGYADEQTPLDPNTPYGRSKQWAERCVLDAGHIVLRLPVLYGPGDRGNVGRLIDAVLSGRFLLPSGAAAKRSMLSTFNAAEAVRCALSNDIAGRVFLVTDDADSNLADLVELIARAAPQPVRIRTAPYAVLWPVAALGSLAARLGVTSPITLDRLKKLLSPLAFSCERAKQELGYRPLITPDAGIRAAVLDRCESSKRETPAR
jgi:nucleoside-diphosphate-sugar epimerase